MKTENQIVDEIIVREGDEYTNRTADRGGPTKYGITLKTLAEYRRRPVTPKDVEDLTREEAAAIYKLMFIHKPSFDMIPNEKLKVLMIDCGVLHGPARAAEWLQAFLGVKQDGDLGHLSFTALYAADFANAYYAVLRTRYEFIGTIVNNDLNKFKAKLGQVGIHLQAESELGWIRRVNQFLEKF